MQPNAHPDHAAFAALAALIAHVASDLATLATTSSEAYAPLRLALALIARDDLPLDVALTLRTYLEDHCRHCGAVLPQGAWHTHRIPWCGPCRAVGVAQEAALWSPEDWPDAPERAWCQAQLAEAEHLGLAGDTWEVWRALEAVYLAAETRSAWREQADLEGRLAPLAAARGDWRYALKLHRRQRAWYGELGDTERLAQVEARIAEVEAQSQRLCPGAR